MTKIFHLVYRDEYEAEGFFTEHGELIHGWCSNDANWRSEYMNPLLSKLGIQVERLPDNSPEHVIKLREWIGE